ncbi:hypothetical protein GP5015_1203 [gamma proteobacterium HTCC5015]|nr:hypothetical protein GP5015_1203 [gamma proteobacterium HTCC5015]
MKTVSFIAVFTCLLFSPLVRAASPLETMGQLARDGAPQLALELLDRAQPSASDNIGGWMFFERQRIAILGDWQEWRELALRLESLPPEAPEDFRRWADLQRANAFLQIKKSAWAMETLRELVWSDTAQRSADNMAAYQRLIIRAYLQQDRLEDARRSLIRYRASGWGKTEPWAILQARLALRSGRPEQVVTTLEAFESEEAKVLKTLALLHTQSDPLTVLKQAQSALTTWEKLESDSTRSHVADRWRWQWVVMAANRSLQRPADLLSAQEALLNGPGIEGDRLFQFDAEQLWQSYIKQGLAEGNRRQLLVGEANAWAEVASEMETPALQRAFYAVIAENAHTQEERDVALLALDDSFGEGERADAVRWALWMDSNAFTGDIALPDNLRYRLIDLALARHDMLAAARLMNQLDTAPEGVEPLDWQLQRARVWIMSGDAPAGARELQQLLRDNAELELKFVDRVVQVVFDLQSVQAHSQAIPLLQTLLKRPLPNKLQRELLFWLADSWKAEEDTARAAAYYLRSATLVDGVGNDPWGQTARYQAAEVLVEGGFYDDAERIFEGLLKVTAEAGRRATLRNQLQSLRLKRNHHSPSNPITNTTEVTP